MEGVNTHTEHTIYNKQRQFRLSCSFCPFHFHFNWKSREKGNIRRITRTVYGITYNVATSKIGFTWKVILFSVCISSCFSATGWPITWNLLGVRSKVAIMISGINSKCGMCWVLWVTYMVWPKPQTKAAHQINVHGGANPKKLILSACATTG